MNGEAHLFTVALSKASQNKLINEVALLDPLNSLQQVLKTVQYNYNKAPYFEVVFELIKKIEALSCSTISDLAINSVKVISDYLELNTLFEISSESYTNTKELEKADRLIAISKQKGSDYYINPIGGMDLYDKAYFKADGVNLQFIKNELLAYKQFNTESVLGLSIIDVLMFNTKEETIKLIEQYKLI